MNKYNNNNKKTEWTNKVYEIEINFIKIDLPKLVINWKNKNIKMNEWDTTQHMKEWRVRLTYTHREEKIININIHVMTCYFVWNSFTFRFLSGKSHAPVRYKQNDK